MLTKDYLNALNRSHPDGPEEDSNNGGATDEPSSPAQKQSAEGGSVPLIHEQSVCKSKVPPKPDGECSGGEDCANMHPEEALMELLWMKLEEMKKA
ncbi:hypothetical protein P152DRAFT_480998 [Eremomyces bilateralis CBS 781.70]|uniref:Uncharacterized protein n=1 Tax=Eremomyces bilateralis CBS 781.70 TaxID=1392243 RepID=A0A6G1G6W2_9PEZI|nr:uncharacterized protein P152DRAFT_480998 [Eremomyces bilateralis CBS 781.70]KAF1813783.1 hypothetical protein P152DRAFT_480998 [Eremomyces bilateralis CBS 781.70]